MSNISDKSLGDISLEDKSKWREFTAIDDFFNYTGWDRELSAAFVAEFGQTGELLHEAVLESAMRDLKTIRGWLSPGRQGELIRWATLPLDNEGLSDDPRAADDIVYTWILVKKVNYFIRRNQKDKSANILQMLLPIECQLSDVEEQAFHQPQRRAADGLRPSDIVLEKILRCYEHYTQSNDAEEFMAPYVSIIGPSGIGKSFTVAQLALEHGLYVSYSSLAPGGSLGYPPRSPVADMIPIGFPRSEITKFWECFITICIKEAESCEAVGISPGAFYHLQVLQTYSQYQQQFAAKVRDFFKIGADKTKDHRARTQETVKFLTKNDEDSKSTLLAWKDVLVENKDNSPQPIAAYPQRRVPQVIICIDEARELIDNNGSIPFRSFREALRNRFRRTSKKGRFTNLSSPLGDFFAVVLDTTSQVGHFSPAPRHDPSQKRIGSIESYKLFPPILAIDTMDVFALPGSNAVDQDGSDDAVCQLFRYGRPLWGGRLESGESLKGIISLADQKTRGHGDRSTLALLSYRLNFYVTSGALAEDLVSRWMRYVLYIDQTRELMRTTQPSEPILAYTAAKRMLNPGLRHRVIKDFARASFEGSVNLGDIGEIVAGLLLLFAYDESHSSHEFTLPTPLSLKDFLGSLFCQEALEQINERMGSDPEMKALWKEGSVFFNHLIKLQDPPSHDTLRLAYNRGAALFLPDRFPGADILIPVKMSAEMTFCAVQIKNRKNDSLTSGLKNNAVSSLESAVEAMGLSGNYLGIMMCLRSQDTAPTPAFDIPVPERRRRSRSYNWSSRPKKLVVVAVGLHEILYPFLNICGGIRTAETDAILPLLRHLLDCIPGLSLPQDADISYVRHLMPVR